MNNFFVDLNHLELMSVSGLDSKKFLQGQLTCNVETLNSHSSCLGAACDNKGRVLSNFQLVNLNEIFYLQMQPGLLSLFKQTLEKYSVFYKVEIKDSTKQYYRYGIVGNECESFLQNIFQKLPIELNQIVSVKNNYLIKVAQSPTRYELWLDELSQISVILKLTKVIAKKTQINWELLDIQAGIFQIEQIDSGLYTPQSINLDLSNFIDFSKGCYTGQEIVARMHYRGNAKKRLFHLEIQSEEEVANNSKVILKDGAELGKIYKIRYTGKNTYHALASLKADIKDDTLSIKGIKSAQVLLHPIKHPTASGYRVT